MTIYQSPRLFVRLYDNPKFGRRVGPRRVNQLVFNGSITINDADKMHVDLATPNNVEQTVDPKSLHMSLVLAELAVQLGYRSGGDTNVLVGQLKFVQPNTCFVDGGLVVNLQTRDVAIFIWDEEGQLALNEKLELVRCRAPSEGKNSPNYMASNYDPDSQRRAPDESARLMAATMLSQVKQLVSKPVVTDKEMGTPIPVLRY